MADLTLHDLTRADQVRLARRLLPLWLRHRQPPPPLEYRPPGRLHSKARDRKVISHHYDVSNRFYEWVLGPSMAYTCAVFPTASATLEEAQAAKFELVAQKLGLQPGMRLLDVGCGWGGMVMHAAAEHGVKALGVTLSRNQAEWAQAEIVRRGLGDLAEVRHLDYRDAPESEFDAISSIGLTEHIGKDQLPNYFRSLYERLRPGGRLLNHCITQPRTPLTRRLDPFIARYVFPDGQLEPVGHLISRDERRRASRSGTRRTCASTTPSRWPAGAPTSKRTGTRPWPRSASAGPGCGGSTWPHPGSGSSATTSSCTRCSG